MKAFLDTSVLVATFYADHEHHPPSIDLFLRFGKKGACCGAHSLAEVYATLTSIAAHFTLLDIAAGAGPLSCGCMPRG